MSEDGYTLAEMLAALMIIGLTIGGITETTRVVGLLQVRAGQSARVAMSSRAPREALTRLLAGQGPFFGEGLSGSPEGFSFACHSNSTCGARLETSRGATSLVVTLAGVSQRTKLSGGAHFAYVDDAGANLNWPTGAVPPQRLRSILLVRDAAGEGPLAAVRLWREEPAGCVFDPVAQGCRLQP